MISRRSPFTVVLFAVFLVGAILATGGCGQNQETPGVLTADEPSRPNIIMILPDDLGWSDVGYNGSSIQTPNIDRLARNGVRLDQHYVMPSCTPTRVGFITGRYPSRFGVTGPDYGEVIERGTTTLSALLDQMGYHTAITGKWHMGSPPHTPLKYGFDSSYGYFDGQVDPYTHYYKRDRKETVRRTWHRNDEYLDEEGHVTDLITDEAVRVINEHQDDPFFLYVAYSVPHYPLDEPEKWTSIYDDTYQYPSRRWYAASVTHMDHGIGQILDALEETGQRQNTLIVFSSDNGGQHSWHSETQYKGRYADKPHRVLGNNFPLRGWKTELYEGGIRVPAFVNWPGRLDSDSVDVPLQIEDWMPTFLEVAGSPDAADSLQLDGRNIWPLLTGQESDWGPREMYWNTGDALAVRQGPWKLIVNREDGTTELFNLEDDFRETEDLSGDMPEKVREMRGLLKEFQVADG